MAKFRVGKKKMKARIKSANEIKDFKKGVFEYLCEDGEFYKEHELEYIDKVCVREILDNMEDMPIEFSRIVDEHFDELI